MVEFALWVFSLLFLATLLSFCFQQGRNEMEAIEKHKKIRDEIEAEYRQERADNLKGEAVECPALRQQMKADGEALMKHCRNFL